MHTYALSHLDHHRASGTREDPDLPNYAAYPVSGSSFKRKLIRDITGQTGFAILKGLFSSSGGDIMMRKGEKTPVWPGVLVNLVMFTGVYALNAGLLYLLWVAAFLITYPLFARLRQLAEHAAVIDLYDPDPRRNTRTTIPGMLARLLVCPNHVNYHIEHHLLPSVPAYHLGAMHKLLVSKGFYDGFEHAVVRGYPSVFKTAVPGLAQSPS